MMGFQGTPARLFYDFCLEEHVPADHMLRGIDRHLALDDLRQSLKPFLQPDGPAFDRSGADDPDADRRLLPRHPLGAAAVRGGSSQSGLSLVLPTGAGRQGSGPFDVLARTATAASATATFCASCSRPSFSRCMKEGLVGGEGFAVDASLIVADATAAPVERVEAEEVKEHADRAAREYLAMLDDAAFGGATPVTPKFISPSDPAAQWTGAHKGHAFFAYANNYLIDTEHAVIIDVEATRAMRQAEVGAAERCSTGPRALRHEARHAWSPTAPTVRPRCWPGWSNSKEIEPHIPVFDKSKRTDGTFSRADFVFDPEADRYTCPAGKELRSVTDAPTPRPDAASQPKAQDSIAPANGIAMPANSKPSCCPNAPARKVARDIHEDARDLARAHRHRRQAYVEACRRRKKVEMLFAHLKRILSLGRLRLRGPNGAKDEFLLAATAQNLRRLARLRPKGGLKTAKAA